MTKKRKKSAEKAHAPIVAPAEKPNALTDMQEAFVREYLIDMNASAAAIRAGYSEASADQLGYQALQIPSVRSAIQEQLKQRFERLDLMGSRILLELFRVATADLAQAYDDDGNLLSIKEMPEDFRRAIAGVESEETFEGFGEDRIWTGYARKIKLFDKNRALEMLAKYFKLLNDKVEHEHKFNWAELVAGSWDVKK